MREHTERRKMLHTILWIAEISVRAVAAFTGLAKLIFEIKSRHQKSNRSDQS